MPLFVCLNYLGPTGIPILQALLVTYPRILLFSFWTMLQQVGPLSLFYVVYLNIRWYTSLPFVITGTISPHYCTLLLKSVMVCLFILSTFPLLLLYFNIVWSLSLCMIPHWLFFSLFTPPLPVLYWWPEVNVPYNSPHQELPWVSYFLTS